MEKRNVDKEKVEVALQARFTRKDKKKKGKWSLNRGRGNYHNNGGKDSQNFNNATFQAIAKVATIEEDGKMNDKSNVQCYNCQKLGYFAHKCHTNKNDP